jgi:hypothetical protein
MYDSVIEFGKFSTIPTIGGSHKITCYALKTVDIGTATMGAFLQIRLSILVTTIHATVTVMVN